MNLRPLDLGCFAFYMLLLIGTGVYFTAQAEEGVEELPVRGSGHPLDHRGRLGPRRPVQRHHVSRGARRVVLSRPRLRLGDGLVLHRDADHHPGLPPLLPRAERLHGVRVPGASVRPEAPPDRLGAVHHAGHALPGHGDLRAALAIMEITAWPLWISVLLTGLRRDGVHDARRHEGGHLDRLAPVPRPLRRHPADPRVRDRRGAGGTPGRLGACVEGRADAIPELRPRPDRPRHVLGRHDRRDLPQPHPDGHRPDLRPALPDRQVARGMPAGCSGSSSA